MVVGGAKKEANMSSKTQSTQSYGGLDGSPVRATDGKPTVKIDYLHYSYGEVAGRWLAHVTVLDGSIIQAVHDIDTMTGRRMGFDNDRGHYWMA